MRKSSATALSGLLAMALLAGCQPFDAGAGFAAREPGLRLLDRNPWAARQRTPAGRRLQTVEYHDGRVYVGYGDWRANTGPVAVSSWDVQGEEWTWHFRAATEAIERYRVLDGELIVPFTDPAGDADYANGPDWRAARAGEGPREAFYHVFDAARTGAGLFLVGTRRHIGEAQVLRWDGDAWRDSLVLEGRADWLWFGAVLGDELWVQSEAQGAFRHDGEDWRPAPRLFVNPRARALVSVGDRVASITRTRGAGQLQVSNGREASIEARADAWDLNLDQESGWVYLLREDGIERSRDLLEWERLPVPVPPGACAIDAGGGHLWIGTRDSRLWAIELAGG